MPDALDGDFSRSRAVLIGTWDYTHLKPVPAAKHSLDRMRALLASPLCGGWPEGPMGRVEVVDNRRKPGDLPHELVTWLSDAADVALFYYVGHGQYDNDDRLCLSLADSSDDPVLRTTTSLTFDHVRHAFRVSRAATKIAILDCCFAGLAAGPHGTLAAARDLPSSYGFYLMMASGEYSTAWFQPDTEHPQPQTYFTKYLADVIERGIPRQPEGLTLGSIFDKVADALARDGKPVPRSHTSDHAARYVFARNPTILAAHQHTRAEALARTASTLRAPLVNHLQHASGPLHQATDAYITPLARKLADERGVDLISIKGTGVGGRVRKQDVIAAANANSATSRLVDQSKTPSPKTSEENIVGALLLFAGVVAGIIFLPEILSSTPPDDAPKLSTAHVGDCAASKRYSEETIMSDDEISYKEVPCWYRSANYRVLKISAPNYNYNGSITIREPDRKVCQGVSGWDSGYAVEVLNSSSGTLIYCLAHKPWLGG